MRWIVFVIAAVVIFTVFVTVYAASAERERVRLFPKWVWVIMCLVLPPVGGLIYLVVGRPLTSGRSSGPKTRTRPMAPDEDPTFLRDIAEKIRRQEAEKASAQATPDEPKGSGKDSAADAANTQDTSGTTTPEPEGDQKPDGEQTPDANQKPDGEK